MAFKAWRSKIKRSPKIYMGILPERAVYRLRSDRAFNSQPTSDRSGIYSGIDPLLLSDYVAIALLIFCQIAIARITDYFSIGLLD
jgi:hypothetical protein